MSDTSKNSVNSQELWFLILHHISDSPLSNLVPALEAELHAHRLLPERHTITGTTQLCTYAQLREQNSHVKPSHLQDLLSHYHALKDEHTEGVKGVHSLLRRIDNDGASQQPGSTSRVSLAPVAAGLHATAPRPCRHLLQETGQSCYDGKPHALISDEFWVSKLHHLRTFRGHTAPVYCITTTDRYIITGSDDCLVKIWCMPTGVLLMTCRGHEAELTDTKISCDGKYLASAAQDNVIRIWSLEDGKLGFPVSVLLGCEKIVTFLHWNPVVPNVLASVSADGACRVWDVHGEDPVPLRPSPTFGRRASNIPLSARAMRAAMGVDPATGLPIASHREGDAEPEPFALLCCTWSPDGTFLVAGGNNCIAYMWHWELASPQNLDDAALNSWRENIADLQSMNEKERSRSGKLLELPRKEWPIIHEQCQLMGHRNNIPLVKFSRDGQRLGTASADGTVRLFHLERSPKRGKENWVEKAVLSNQPIQKNVAAQRRRKGPAIPTINQLEWSLDDRLIVVALSDYSIRVWDPTTKVELHCLTGHTKDLYEIAFHPSIPNLAASWAHDGIIILWNVATGKKLREFSSKKTYPGKGLWTEPLMLLDGGWNTAGSKLFATDTSGQFHVFGLGPADICGRAEYDQFWKSDYAELGRDPHGWVIDTASNRAPHINPDKRVGDWFCSLYDEPYQSLSARNQLSRGVPIRNWRKGTCPRGVLSAPPVVSAADHDVRVHGGGDVAAQNAAERVTRAQDELMDRIRSGAVVLSDDDESDIEWVSPLPRATNPVELTGVIPRNAGAGEPGPSRRTPQRPAAGVSAAAGLASVQALAAIPLNQVTVSDDDELSISSSDNEADDANYIGSDTDLLQMVGQRRRPSRAQSEAEFLSDASTGSDAEEMSLGDESPAATRGRTRSSRAARRAQRENAAAAGGATRAVTRAPRGQAGPATGVRERQPSRRLLESAADEIVRRSSRARERHVYLDLPSDEEELFGEFNDAFSSDDSRGGRARIQRGEDRQTRRERRERQAQERTQQTERQARGTRASHASRSHRSRNRGRPKGATDRAKRKMRRAKAKRQQAQAQRARPSRTEGLSNVGRPECNYAWLVRNDHTPAFYAPQVGDRVVYCRQSHISYLEAQNDKLSRLPWQQLTMPAGDRQGSSFRAFERCSVEQMEYHISNDGRGFTLARVHLKLSHPQHEELRDQTFTVDLPPPVAGHAEFVVLEKRFEQSCLQDPPLAVGSRVKSFQIGEHNLGQGDWYNGTIIEDSLSSADAELLSSSTIWSTAGLLNRFKVRWDRQGDEDEDEVEELSAWEFYPHDADEADIKSSFQNLGADLEAVCARVHEACAQMCNRDIDSFGMLLAAPEWDTEVKAGSRTFAYTQHVALPFAIFNVLERAGCNYYRSVAQIRLDISTIPSNALQVWGKGHTVTRKALLVKKYLFAAIDGKPAPDLDDPGYSSLDDSMSLSGSEAASDAEDRNPDEAGPSGRALEPLRASTLAMSGALPTTSADSGAAAGVEDAAHSLDSAGMPLCDDAAPVGGAAEGSRPNRGTKRGRRLESSDDDAIADDAAAEEGGAADAAVEGPTPSKRPRSQRSNGRPAAPTWAGAATWLSGAEQGQNGEVANGDASADAGGTSGAEPPSRSSNTVRLRLKGKGFGATAARDSERGGRAAAQGVLEPEASRTRGARHGIQNSVGESNLPSTRQSGAAATRLAGLTRRDAVGTGQPEAEPLAKRTRRAPSRLSPDAYLPYDDSFSSSEDDSGDERRRRSRRTTTRAAATGVAASTRSSGRHVRARGWS